MFISKEKISERQIIREFVPDNFYEIGYDLRIQGIITSPSDQSNLALDEYELVPGATVFVSTIETIAMPNDLLGWVIPKNSLIRSGLQIEAPIYQPGHSTRIYIRVTNISSDICHLKKEQKIAAIMFATLDQSVESYKGQYVDEFDYKGLAKYPKDAIPRIVKVEEKVDEKIAEIEELEDSLLGKVITIMTVFVGLFSLININVNFVEQKNICTMLAYNLISVGSIGFLVGFISILLKKIGKKTTGVIFGISVAMVAVALVLIFKAPNLLPVVEQNIYLHK